MEWQRCENVDFRLPINLIVSFKLFNMVFFSTGVTSAFVFRFIVVLSASLSCRLYKLVNSPAEFCECGAAVLEAALGGGDGSGGCGTALGRVGYGGEFLSLLAEGGGGSAGALAELCGAGADLAGGGDDGVEVVAGVVWCHGPVLSWKLGGLNSCGAQGL